MVFHNFFRGKEEKPTKQNKRRQAWSYTVSSGERKKSPQNRMKEDKHGLAQFLQGKGRKAHKTESKRTSMVLHSCFKGKKEKPTKQNEKGECSKN